MSEMNYEELRSELDFDEERLFGASRIVERWADEQATAQSETNVETADGYAILRTASLNVRAATLWMFRDVEHAMALFSRASRFYLQLGRPYALLTAACGGMRQEMTAMTLDVESDNRVESVAPELEVQRYTGLVLAYVLGRAEPDPRRLHGARARLASYSEDTIGRLRVPAARQLAVLRRLETFALIRTLQGYGSEVGPALRELDLPTDAETELGVGEQLVAPFVEYLREVDEQVGRAMRDRYHWRLFHSRQLPIEPEALALALGVLVATDAAGMEAQLKAAVQEQVSPRAAIPARLADGLLTTMRVGA